MCSHFIQTIYENTTRKATGFKSLRLDYWEINQATYQNVKLIFGKSLEKNSKIEESEHHYKILHIQISLGTKFRLKLIFLNFWIKLTQKGYFQTKSSENYH